MKIAHILPPMIIDGRSAPYLDQYHLLLPSLAPSQNYRNVYREAPGFKIMDNGIAEGDRVSFAHQMYVARVLGCEELVLPDVMKQDDKTLTAVAEVFYEAFQKRNEHKYMFVAQGKTVMECIHCVERALNMFPGIINSIGVPRHIVSEGLDARVRIAEHIRNMSPNRPIHLLGTHPEAPHELFAFKQSFRRIGIRGVDTSLAYNATLCGHQLKDPAGLNYNISIKRQPMGEFVAATVKDVNMKLLIENMKRLNAWAM
jgi:hypothetical protein